MPLNGIRNKKVIAPEELRRSLIMLRMRTKMVGKI